MMVEAERMQPAAGLLVPTQSPRSRTPAGEMTLYKKPQSIDKNPIY
jgi:hypothetical protein